MNPSKKLFGERLAQRRKQLGLSQRELAKRIGIRGPSLAEYETDETWPSVPTLIALAQALDCSLDWLCGLTENLMPLNNSAKPHEPSPPCQ